MSRCSLLLLALAAVLGRAGAFHSAGSRFVSGPISSRACSRLQLPSCGGWVGNAPEGVAALIAARQALPQDRQPGWGAMAAEVRQPWRLKLAMTGAQAMSTAYPLPTVIGHRGAKAISPENTIAGIRAAKAWGTTCVEVDLSFPQIHAGGLSTWSCWSCSLSTWSRWSCNQ